MTVDLQQPFYLLLAGRKVIAFPDVDDYDTWMQKAAERPHPGIIVSDLPEKNATPENCAAHIDIADRLIAQIRDGSLVPPADCPTPSPASSHYGTKPQNMSNLSQVSPLSHSVGQGTTGHKTEKKL